MSFDEQPDGDIHGECAAEIHRLQRALNFWIPAVPDIGEAREGCCERDMKVIGMHVKLDDGTVWATPGDHPDGMTVRMTRSYMSVGVALLRSARKCSSARKGIAAPTRHVRCRRVNGTALVGAEKPGCPYRHLRNSHIVVRDGNIRNPRHRRNSYYYRVLRDAEG